MRATVWYSKNFPALPYQQNRPALDTHGFHLAFLEFALFYGGHKTCFVNAFRLQDYLARESSKTLSTTNITKLFTCRKSAISCWKVRALSLCSSMLNHIWSLLRASSRPGVGCCAHTGPLKAKSKLNASKLSCKNYVRVKLRCFSFPLIT